MSEAHDGLRVSGVSKRFGPTVALDDVDMDVRPGEVMALLGENGAGKSTLGSLVAGVQEPDSGTMSWRGQDYAPGSPRDALNVGIALIHQEIRLLPELTIAENVFVGRLPMSGGRVDRPAMNRGAQEQLDRLGLDLPADRKVAKLSIAAQQQIEIAKALSRDASLIILDEPTAALGAEQTDQLFAQLDRLQADGVAFIYVSHRLEEIAKVADRITVLRDGQRVAEHDGAAVAVNTLVEEMVGRSVDRLFPDIPAVAPEARVVLAARGLTSAEGAFQDVEIELRAGEILGVAGVVGAGRTELVRALAGADPIAAGAIEVEGQPVALRNPHDAIAAGIALVPEDRKAQGIVLDDTVADNIALASFDRLAHRGFIRPGQIDALARDGIDRMKIKGRPTQPARALSGGNQQKAVLAKWLAREPRVVILDEPTRGIDMGARASIYDLIAGLAGSGVGVIVVSSDLDEVLGLSHRVMVMSRGQQRGTLDRSEATDVAVMELATA